MTGPTYILHANGSPERTSEEQRAAMSDLIDWRTEDRTEEISAELVTQSMWTDYADLALKALLVIAAFVIAARL